MAGTVALTIPCYGKAYNKPEKNKNRVPTCPKEKELAIMDALKAFRMLAEDTEYMEAAL